MHIEPCTPLRWLPTLNSWIFIGLEYEVHADPVCVHFSLSGPAPEGEATPAAEATPEAEARPEGEAEAEATSARPEAEGTAEPAAEGEPEGNANTPAAATGAPPTEQILTQNSCFGVDYSGQGSGVGHLVASVLLMAICLFIAL